MTATKNAVITATTVDPYGTKTHVVGAVVTVTGTKFADNAPITLMFMGNEVANPNSNSTGGFVTQFTIPQGSAGNYSISATDGTRTASLAYALVAHLSTNSTKVSPGASVTLSGNGYAGRQPGDIHFQRIYLGIGNFQQHRWIHDSPANSDGNTQNNHTYNRCGFSGQFRNCKGNCELEEKNSFLYHSKFFSEGRIPQCRFDSWAPQLSRRGISYPHTKHP